MQSSFLSVFKYNLSGQLFSRLCSFFINLYLIRTVNLSILGFLFVRMNLFYQTIGFLSREPFRKTCLNPNLSIKDSFHYALISTTFFFGLSIICCIIWWFLPVPDQINLKGNYNFILMAFVCSCWFEGIVEPIAILSLKLEQNAFFALSHSLLTFLQKFIAFLLILFKTNVLTAFCLAQCGASFFYSVFLLWKFFSNYSLIIQNFFTKSWLSEISSYHYEKKTLLLIGTIFVHSILKQLITDGSAYVMTFTKIFSFETQAVYDAIERLGSLITRVVLTPLEESAAIFFSTNIQSNIKNNSNLEFSKTIPENAVVTFISLLRLVVILGMVVCVFGIPYSNIVVLIYGGKTLVENKGAMFLSMYVFYLLFMAINGVTECFAFISMNAVQLFSHGKFLFFSAFVHLFLNFILSKFFGPSGFIIANCINSLARIVYNWRHISSLLNKKTTKITIKTILPNINFVFLLILALILTTFSYFLFNKTGGLLHNGAHLAVGGVMFLLVLAYIYQSEQLFNNFFEKIR